MDNPDSLSTNSLVGAIQQKHPLTVNPWVYFSVFLISNTFLSYGQYSTSVNLWIFLFGIFLPLFVLFLTTPAENLKPLLHSPTFPPLPAFGIFTAFMAAALLRTFRLFHDSVWPMWDDGHYSFFAVDLFEHWHWQYFFGSEQYTPLYTWFQALFYDVFHPSLSTMWIYPVVYSILAIPTLYLATMRCFGKNFSVIFTALAAFSFWPIYSSKFACDVIFNLFGQCFVLFLLQPIICRENQKEETFSLRMAVTGFFVGSGWCFSKFWGSTFLGVTVLLFFLHWNSRQITRNQLKSYLACAGLFLLPLVYLLLANKYGGHIWNYFVFSNSERFADFLNISKSYLSEPFWGENISLGFGSFFGGLFNPLLAASFFVGLTVLFRNQKFTGLLLLLFFIYFLPGILSTSLEFMRIFPSMPLFFGVMAVGILELSQSIRPNRRWLIFLAFLGVSLFIDLFQLWVAYPAWAFPGVWSGPSKSPERYRAYQILEREKREKGPGIILDQLVPDIFDQTLLTAAYPFNAACNSALKPLGCKWAALLVPVQGPPHPLERIPGTRHYDLSTDIQRYDEGLNLWIVPVTAQDSKMIVRWSRVNRAFQSLYPLIPYHVQNPSCPILLSAVRGLLDESMDDDFLKSSIFQKWLEYNFIGNNFETFAANAKEEIRRGHPRSVTLYRLGLILLSQKQYPAAVELFNKCEKLNPKLPFPQYLFPTETH